MIKGVTLVTEDGMMSTANASGKIAIVTAIETATVIGDGAAVVPGVAAVALARANQPRERSTRSDIKSGS